MIEFIQANALPLTLFFAGTAGICGAWRDMMRWKAREQADEMLWIETQQHAMREIRKAA